MTGKEEYEIAIVSKYKEANALLDDLLVYLRKKLKRRAGYFYEPNL